MESPAPIKKPISAKIRYTALLLSCFFAFGGYLVYDLCSALQAQILESLNIDNTRYSLLYSVYSWTNCVMVLFAGAIIDNTTNRGCAMLFCSLACLGQIVLSIGVQVKNFWVMLLGRVVFGTGLGSICVTQNTISNTYFKDYDLATAFAATLTVSRIGSVLNFFLSTYIYTWFGSRLNVVFWWGTCMTFISVIAAFLFFFLDRYVEREGIVVSAIRKSKKIKWKDIISFPPIYWILCIICSLYYICIFALMAVIVDYLKQRDSPDGDTFDSSSDDSFNHKYSMYSSIIYLVAIPCVPFFGRLIDHVGKRMIFLAISVFVIVPFNCYLVFCSYNEIPALVIAGMSYSMVASCLWPSICMVVRDETVGTANGIATSIQMIGIGISNLVVGVLKDKYSYDEVTYYFIACATLGTILTIFANVMDTKYLNGYLNNHSAFSKDKKPEETVAEGEENEKTPLIINDDSSEAK